MFCPFHAYATTGVAPNTFFDVRIDSLDGRTCALQLDNEHFQKHPVNGLIQKTICLPVTAIFCNKQFLRNVRVTSTCKSMDEALVRALFKKNIFPLQNDELSN